MKEKMKRDTLQVLDWQKQQNEQKKNVDSGMTELEKAMLNSQWLIEQDKEAEMKRQALLLNKERNLEIIRQNLLEKQIIEAGQKNEKDRDRDMVQQAVERERAIEQQEADDRERRRKEAKDLQEYYKLSKADQLAEEKLIDEMVRLEELKTQKVQDNKWKAEEEARLQLMREVYESRSTHIEHLKRMKASKEIEVQREMAELRQALAEQDKLLEEK